MMIEYTIAMGAMYIFVALKSFQQRNVNFDKVWWVMPVSYLMSFAEVYVIALIAHTGYTLWLPVTLGTGAGLGALSGMYLHRRWT